MSPEVRPRVTDPTDDTERTAWVEDLRHVDPVAVERLVAEYEGPLYRYFLARHGDPERAGAQSVDCFAELVRALPRLRGGPEQLRGFAYAVARNVERRRWRQRQTHRPLDDAGDQPSTRPDPQETAAAREELARTLELLKRLDPITRDVFLLRFVEDLPIDEVARTLDLPVGTVKSRIHRGRKRLSELLEPNHAPQSEGPKR